MAADAPHPLDPTVPAVPASRRRTWTESATEPRTDGAYVLYWMVGQRRTDRSFALDEAVRQAAALGVPLVIFEPLRAGYRWASQRHHAFVLQGMADNRAACADPRGVRYVGYVEPEPGAGRGMLEALATRAALVMTDDVPVFFLPRMIAKAARDLDRAGVPLLGVEGLAYLPLSSSGRSFPTAHSFRRFVQKELLRELPQLPAKDPLAAFAADFSTRVDDADAKEAAVDQVLAEVEARFPFATDAQLAADDDALGALPVDDEVPPVRSVRGGRTEARAKWQHFLDQRLDRYSDDRSHPDEGIDSGLSPYLHYGHIGGAELVEAVLRREGWEPANLADKASGSREGFWGVSPAAESFLDQIVTWRELGHHSARYDDEIETFGSLPAWAQKSHDEHRDDPRPVLYSLDELERAETHDELWNAAQRQLRHEGTIHNALRMLWGKKILEWSPSPEDALERMVHLNHRWALDGRDPNSTSGILWVLGRYDRAWGPERPIFGKIRYMSSDNSRRKWRLKRYLARYGDQQSLGL